MKSQLNVLPVVVVALIAAARIEQRPQSIARAGRRGRNDPGAVEERIADEEFPASLDVEIRGRPRERLSIHFENRRRAAGIHCKQLGRVDRRL